MLSLYWFKDRDTVSAPEIENFKPVQEIDSTIEKFNFEECAGKCYLKDNMI